MVSAIIKSGANGILLLCFLPMASAAEPSIWRLESSIARALEVVPEIGVAQAGIEIREGEALQAGAWPNPTLEMRADGREQGWRDTDWSEFAISQPLPFSRLARQRTFAQANLSLAYEQKRYSQALIEHRAARAFHALQLATAQVALAQRRVGLAETPQGNKRDPLIRYLSPLEKMRLKVLQEAAQQNLRAAETEYRTAEIDFKTLLSLPAQAAVKVAPLTTALPEKNLEALRRGLEAHPLLTAAQKELEASTASVEVAKAQRFAVPAVSLFRNRDFSSGTREDTFGVGMSLQIPLWNTNNGGVAVARAGVSKARAELEIRTRDLRNQLARSYAELEGLIKQAESYRMRLLEPSARVLDLTRKGFRSGELGLLVFIDANNSYFDANAEYLNLLYQENLAANDLYLAAGISQSQLDSTANAAATWRQP